MNFFGLSFTNLYVNNNGNVTFDSALSTYTPFSLSTTSREIIAPFFADVDTAAGGSPVTYGTDTVDGHPAFGVDWINVDFFGGESSASRNSFELVLIDRSDVAAGDFDFEFNYDQIQWEAGTASGGDTNGLGGSSARAGYSNGTNTSFEITGSAVNGAFLDSNSGMGLIHRSFNSSVPGRFLFHTRGGTVLGGCSDIAGFAAQIDALSISRSQRRILSAGIGFVSKSVQANNFFAARRECTVFDRKLAALVRLGLVDQSTADSLISCCATLSSSPAISGDSALEEMRLQALKGRVTPQ